MPEFDPLSELVDVSDALIRHKNSLQGRVMEGCRLVSNLNAQLIRCIEEGGESRADEIRQLKERLEEAEEANNRLHSRITVHEDEIKRLTDDLEGTDAERGALQEQVEALRHQNESLAEKVRETSEYANGLSQDLASLKQSLVYQITARFHYSIIEHLLPLGSSRRLTYDRGIKALRHVYGGNTGSFRWYFREWRGQKRMQRGHINYQKMDLPSILPGEERPVIARTVSVVIPTKNAGPEFAHTLRMITTQKGIQAIELIVVDSGSTDGTPEMAKNFGAQVLTIASEEFNHGETRNTGADNANGDFVLFMVQDAIPIGDDWLYRMANTLERDEAIAAVTCRQVPRSDADLFACFGLWHHYTVTLKTCEDRVYLGGAYFSDLPVEEKRKCAGLENVSCLLRKEVFDRYRFKKVQSSEDLDLGFRLMEDGFKTSFLFSTGVIHSHNRDAAYFLKRSYVDTKTVAGIIGYTTQSIAPGSDLPAIMASIVRLYIALHQAVRTLESPVFMHEPATLATILKTAIHRNMTSADPGCRLPADDDLPCIHLLQTLLEHAGDIAGHCMNTQDRVLMDQYYWLLDEFCMYLSVYDSIAHQKEEFFDSLFKLFAVVAGASLAGYYLHALENDRIGTTLGTIDTVLCGGV
jgi:glycosyltransferase involved in cell wall biosynthesis